MSASNDYKEGRYRPPYGWFSVTIGDVAHKVAANEAYDKAWQAAKKAAETTPAARDWILFKHEP